MYSFFWFEVPGPSHTRFPWCGTDRFLASSSPFPGPWIFRRWLVFLLVFGAFPSPLIRPPSSIILVVVRAAKKLYVCTNSPRQENRFIWPPFLQYNKRPLRQKTGGACLHVVYAP